MFPSSRSVTLIHTGMPVGIFSWSSRYFSTTSSLFARTSRTKKVNQDTIVRRQLKALTKTSIKSRPPSAHNMFIKENLPKAPGESGAQKLSHVSKLWTTVDQREKEKYQKLAEAARAQFIKQKEKITPEDVIVLQTAKRLKKKLGIKTNRTVPRDPSRPKRPLTPYFLFLSDIRAATPDVQRQLLGAPASGMSPQEIAKAAGKAWKALPADRKELYVKQAEAEYARYSADLKSYLSGKKIDDFRKKLLANLRSAARGPESQRKRRVVKRKSSSRNKKVVKRKVNAGKKKPAKKPAKKTAAKKKTTKKGGKKIAKRRS